MWNFQEHIKTFYRVSHILYFALISSSKVKFHIVSTYLSILLIYPRLWGWTYQPPFFKAQFKLILPRVHTSRSWFNRETPRRKWKTDRFSKDFLRNIWNAVSSWLLYPLLPWWPSLSIEGVYLCTMVPLYILELMYSYISIQIRPFHIFPFSFQSSLSFFNQNSLFPLHIPSLSHSSVFSLSLSPFSSLIFHFFYISLSLSSPNSCSSLVFLLSNTLRFQQQYYFQN